MGKFDTGAKNGISEIRKFSFEHPPENKFPVISNKNKLFLFLYLNRLDNFWNAFIGTAPFTKFYLFLKNLKKLKTKIVPKIVSKFVLKDRF